MLRKINRFLTSPICASILPHQTTISVGNRLISKLKNHRHYESHVPGDHIVAIGHIYFSTTTPFGRHSYNSGTINGTGSQVGDLVGWEYCGDFDSSSGY